MIAALRDVLPGIRRVGLVTANAFAVDDDAGTWLIDTGSMPERWLLTAALSKLPGGLDSLAGVILTHGHPDHAGNAGYLRKRLGIPVVCSEAEAPYLRGDRQPRPRDYRDAPWPFKLVGIGDRLVGGDCRCEVDRALRPGERLGGFESIPVHGHSPGHIALLHHPTKTLFVGDALLPRNLLAGTVGLTRPVATFCHDYARACRSLAVLQGLPYEHICFGHGAPMLGGMSAEVDAWLRDEGLAGGEA